MNNEKVKITTKIKSSEVKTALKVVKFSFHALIGGNRSKIERKDRN